MRIESAAALVTGGASGIGEAIARMLSAAGARVAIADLPDSRGTAVAAELGATFVAADLTRTDDVARAVSAFDALDVVVNAAGVSHHQRVLSSAGEMHPLEPLRRVLDVNVVALFDVVRHAARAMAANEPDPDGVRGVIVNIGSIAAFEGQAGQAAYVASKAAVAALTLQLARDLERSGVRVMTVAPGMVSTPMFESTPPDFQRRLLEEHVLPPRACRPEEVADVVRACIEVAALNGEVIRVDAGARLRHHRGEPTS